MGRRRALLLAAALAVAGASGLGAADAAGEGNFPRLVVQPPSDNPAVPAYLSRAIVAPLKLPRGQPLCVVTRVEVKGSAAAGDAGSSSTPQDPPLNNNGAFVEEDPAPAPDVTTPRGVLDHIGEFTGVTNVVEESGSTTALLSRPENIEFKRVAQHFFSDVDPRADYALLGTPGGDMGELLNAMAAVEAASGTLYRPETASVAFQDFLRAMSSRGRRYFYMGTDEAAMAALAKHTGVSDPTRPQSITERNKVLESCVHPEHVGSRHLRGMLTLPATYGVRTELAVYLIRSFWSVYFDPHNPLRRRLLLVKLRGELKPAGTAARVWSPDACPGIAPLLVPSTPKGAVSVYHEAHAKFFRLDLARFFAFRNAELDAGSLYNSMNRLASKQAVLLSDYFAASGIVDVIFTSAVDRWPF